MFEKYPLSIFPFFNDKMFDYSLIIKYLWINAMPLLTQIIRL
jgi:hypothetical protein